MKNSYDAIGNRTLDFPACNAESQPTALLRAPYVKSIGYKVKVSHSPKLSKFTFTCIFYNRHVDASIFTLRTSPISFHVPKINNSFCHRQQTGN
jgi:hypothetical protein